MFFKRGVFRKMILYGLNNLENDVGNSKKTLDLARNRE